MSFVGVVTVVTSAITGTRSTTNVVIESGLLTFPEESVTVIVQSEYVESLKELKVIVLSPETAVVVVLVQLPP